MLFSYKVSGNPILEHVDIPIQRGKVVLLTGVENSAFGLLGGIISGLFPLEDRIDIPGVAELVAPFTGSVEVIEGELPERAVYLGPDPEKHLFFSHVHEEIYAQTGKGEDQSSVLQRFGLREDLLRRKVSTLSGGEKVKLALSIAFSQAVDCIVLHGVIPWLDHEGRRALLHAIVEKKRQGVSIVILEQEIDILKEYTDHILFFKGKTLEPYLEERRAHSEKALLGVSTRLLNELKKERSEEAVLRFDSVQFFYDQQKRDVFHLEDLSFVFYASRIYGLIGENGAGKSTIARLILRTEKPLSGNIRFLDKDISLLQRGELVEKICFLGQFPEQFIILSNVEEYKRYAERSGNSLSRSLLAKYFCEEKTLPVSMLSPLQLKILSVSAFISEETRLIIFDEPTWGIDQEGKCTLLEMLSDGMKGLPNASILMITHDLDFIRRLNAEILLLSGGRISAWQDGEDTTLKARGSV